MSNVHKSAEGWARFNGRVENRAPIRRLHPEYRPQPRVSTLDGVELTAPLELSQPVQPRLRGMRRVVAPGGRFF